MTSSGVYLIVGNFEEPNVRDVLRPTKGGYPHITFLYAGGDSMCNVGAIACRLFNELVHENGLPRVLLAPENVATNCFVEKSTGRERHDVLIHVDAEREDWIDMLRIKLVIEEGYGSDVTMRKPYVTHSIHYTKADADAAADVLRSQLPLTVFITGATID